MVFVIFILKSVSNEVQVNVSDLEVCVEQLIKQFVDFVKSVFGYGNGMFEMLVFEVCCMKDDVVDCLVVFVFVVKDIVIVVEGDFEQCICENLLIVIGVVVGIGFFVVIFICW